MSSGNKAGSVAGVIATSQHMTTKEGSTGDALEDDFGSDLEVEDDDVALTPADKKRKRKRMDKEREKRRKQAT